MDEILIASWAVLFVIGVFAQTIVPMIYLNKLTNQYAGLLSIMLLMSSIPVAIAAFERPTTIYISVITIYFLVNSWVLLQWRYHATRTKRQVVTSAWRLLLLFVAITLLDSAGFITHLNVALLGLLGALLSLIRLMQLGFQAVGAQDVKGNNHPTVTLAVPARNENHALTQHLRSVVRSHYEKLEILVLDDCSHDDTAQIIRSFAHDGVRFIKGQKPMESWLGKNQAYSLLAEEASGDYIIFSGVDTRYDDETIQRIINHMRHKKLSMMSVMPYHDKMSARNIIIQPMRYFLMLMWSNKHNPPVLSTTWVIKASKLHKYGGFAAVQNSIAPEQFFARKAREENAYQFCFGDESLGLTSYKRTSSQTETAIRYLYPRLHKLVSNHAFALAIYTVIWYLPFIMIALAPIMGWSIATSIQLITLVLFWGMYAFIVSKTYPLRVVVSTPLYFVSGVFAMLWLSIVSVMNYELDNIRWKGRNVCYPVMLNSAYKKSTKA